MNQEQITQLGDQVTATATDYSHRIADHVAKTQQNLGRKLEDAGEAMLDHIESASDAGYTAANHIASTGTYLRERKTGDILGDLWSAMARNPAATLVIGLGAGFVFGRVAGSGKS